MSSEAGAPIRLRPLASEDLFVETVELNVSDIRLAADIGVYAHEKGRPQALIIDVVLQIAAPSKDMLTATIDYSRIVVHATDLAAQRTELIETFARRLATLCLESDAVRSVDVRVSKPGALTNGLAAARVFMRRQEDDSAAH